MSDDYRKGYDGTGLYGDATDKSQFIYGQEARKAADKLMVKNSQTTSPAQTWGDQSESVPIELPAVSPAIWTGIRFLLHYFVFLWRWWLPVGVGAVVLALALDGLGVDVQGESNSSVWDAAGFWAFCAVIAGVIVGTVFRAARGVYRTFANRKR